MSVLLTTLLPALAPAIADGFKALIGKATGGAKPLNVAEQVQLMEAETERLKALYSLEGDAATYPWVEAIRKLQRPFVIAVVVLVWASAFLGLTSLSEASMLILADLSSSVMFYLFGERGYMYIKSALSGGKK